MFWGTSRIAGMWSGQGRSLHSVVLSCRACPAARAGDCGGDPAGADPQAAVRGEGQAVRAVGQLPAARAHPAQARPRAVQARGRCPSPHAPGSVHRGFGELKCISAATSALIKMLRLEPLCARCHHAPNGDAWGICMSWKAISFIVCLNRKLDDELRHKAIDLAALYEHRLQASPLPLHFCLYEDLTAVLHETHRLALLAGGIQSHIPPGGLCCKVYERVQDVEHHDAGFLAA